MLSPASRLVFLLGALSLAACANEPDLPIHPAASGIEARFSLGASALPAFLDVPFPTDAYLDPDGTIVDAIPGLDAYVTLNAAALEGTLATQRGFGLLSGAVFRIDRTGKTDAPVVDDASLPQDAAARSSVDSAVLLLDLDAPDADSARVPCRIAYHDDRPNGSDVVPVLAVLPARGTVLAEGHRHAVVLTTAVTADGGKAVGPSAAFATIRDGARSTPIEKMYGDAIDQVVARIPSLADRSRIAALTVFTTQSTSAELAGMRETVTDLPPPALRWDAASLAPMHAALFAAQPIDGYTATLDQWLGAPAKLDDGADDPARDQHTGAAHDAIAVIGTAVFDAPNFLLERPDGYQDLAHATVARDASGRPVLNADKPTSKVWISIALPQGPVPPAGFPVVVLQHGLQGDRSFLLALANTYAHQGWATVAIEAVTFGARSAKPANVVDQISNFPWSATSGYGGPDGFVDSNATALDLFGDFYDFGAPRDQLRQSVVDHATLASILSDPALDLGPLVEAVPGARIDATRIGYVGDSFGSILGAMVATVEPRIGAFVLNVGGGGVMTELVSNAPSLSALVTAAGLNFGFSRDRLDWSHPLVNILQSILDPADPLVHARRIVTSPASVDGVTSARKSVVLIEAVWDEIVANEGCEALALAAGIPLAAPDVGPNGGERVPEVAPTGGVLRQTPFADVTAVLVQASPATHGSDLYNARGVRHFALPFHQPGPTPFPVLPVNIPVREPYLGLQAMTVGFFTSFFAGEVPVVKDFPVPRRDFDDDGVDDAEDGDPLDPSKF